VQGDPAAVTDYAEFNFSHLADMLKEEHGIGPSGETFLWGKFQLEEDRDWCSEVVRHGIKDCVSATWNKVPAIPVERAAPVRAKNSKGDTIPLALT
jgi:hypothetical protein